MQYSEKVLDHFTHPRNVGEIEDANGVGEVGNAKCGDIMKIYLKVSDDGIIEDVKFKTFGCGAAIATSSMATEMVKGKSLEEVAAIAQRFADNMATLAVAVSGATHPATGSLLADLGEDEMEIGMGQHGEGGGGRQTMKSADETAKIMLDGLLADLDIREGEKIMLILNGTGATTLMELFIIYRRCVSYLKEKNIEIVANYVGELLTVQEQAGFQMFMARMDDELLHYWNAPCNTPYMKK